MATIVYEGENCSAALGKAGTSSDDKSLQPNWRDLQKEEKYTKRIIVLTRHICWRSLVFFVRCESQSHNDLVEKS